MPFPPESPGSESTLDPESAAIEAASERLRRLLAGDLVVASPSQLAWEDIESQKLPTGLAKTELCETLDAPRADDLLTEIIALGLNALARRRGRGSLSDESKFVLGTAVSFAIALCPTWNPARLPLPSLPPPSLPPAPEPEVPGFTALPDNPAIAWRLVPTAETACPTSFALCWETQLLADEGCPTYAEMSIAVTDPAGSPLGVAVDWRPSVPPGTMQSFFFEAGAVTHVAKVYALSCY